MKDWIVAGQCLLAPSTAGGFFWGAIFCMLDLGISRLRPANIIWPPLLLVQVGVLFVMVAVFVPLAFWVILPVFGLFILTLSSGICVGICEDQRRSQCSCFLVLLAGVASFILFAKALLSSSAYVVGFAYIVALSHKESEADLRKTYMGVLALPSQSYASGAQTLFEALEVEATNAAVDFLSYARLIIAWSEDWPQGFIGIFVGLLTGSKFAFVSAAVSLAKGLLIPLGQAVILQIKSTQVSRFLRSLVCSDDGLRSCAKAVPVKGRQSYSDLRMQIETTLEKLASQRLKALNILPDRELYAAIFQDRDNWLQSVKSETLEQTQWPEAKKFTEEIAENPPTLPESTTKSTWCSFADCRSNERRIGFAGDASQTDSILDVACGACVRNQLEPEGERLDELREVLQNGFPVCVCRLAGFSIRECLGAGVTAEDCLAANFGARSWKAAGYTAEWCKMQRFTPKALLVFGAASLKSLGVTAAHCREDHCKASDLRQVGFSAEDCRKAGYDALDCKIAGFSADDCKKAGYEAKNCYTAGFSKQECKLAGFSDKDLKKAGFRDCRDVCDDLTRLGERVVGFRLADLVFSPSPQSQGETSSANADVA
eukprot:CAMPEP_0181473068 /NCGR_PEP_ID=MMETSP1110-20121109/39931_1 /TAXON_ID=174948 /ORGANISM="Symbiodinium sp., Strain CCMP421" /LENGTH=599 /DNA_ID=CAMNT_0023598169 /DNA_START=267 /DNA_END=2066 /DNA_ORIENTATION=-